MISLVVWEAAWAWEVWTGAGGQVSWVLYSLTLVLWEYPRPFYKEPQERLFTEAAICIQHREVWGRQGAWDVSVESQAGSGGAQQLAGSHAVAWEGLGWPPAPLLPAFLRTRPPRPLAAGPQQPETCLDAPFVCSSSFPILRQAP